MVQVLLCRHKNCYKQTAVTTLENARDIHIHIYAHTRTYTQYNLNCLNCFLYAFGHKDEGNSQVCNSDYFWMEEICIVGVSFSSLHLTLTFSVRNMYCFYNQKKSPKDVINKSEKKSIGSCIGGTPEKV